jgi:V/A-type H+-transporting ATPase subunit I
MSWRESLQPVRMQRVALVAPATVLPDMLERVAAAGVFELEPTDTEPTRDAELRKRTELAVTDGPVAAFAGWVPAPALPDVCRALEPIGAAAVPLEHPRGVQPPTLLRQRGARAFDPLVKGYTTVPYSDVDPTLLAGLAYVAMFGMMFGDLGHGLLLFVAAVVLRSGRIRSLAGVRQAWPFVAGAGAAASIFGVLYGEFFGPTGLLPVVWLAPLDEPVTLLVVAVGVGAVLIGVAYAVGTVNRVREGGWGFALYSRTGIAGSLLFLALGLLSAGLYFDATPLVVGGVGLGLTGLALAFVGLLTMAGRGGAAVLQAVVELFDVVVRLGSNVVSFARLAAFGLTHAALGAVVWQGTAAAWGSGLSAVAAIAIFVAGNAVALTLEALVAGVQALRLEYYELFSRVFDTEGRPFRPWTLPTSEPTEVTP